MRKITLDKWRELITQLQSACCHLTVEVFYDKKNKRGKKEKLLEQLGVGEQISRYLFTIIAIGSSFEMAVIT